MPRPDNSIHGLAASDTMFVIVILYCMFGMDIRTL